MRVAARRRRPFLVAGLTLLSILWPRAGHAPERAPGADDAAPVSIVVAPGRVITPDQARAPHFAADERDLLLVVDQLRGSLLGHFTRPPGWGPTAGGDPGGFALEEPALEGPPLPPFPLTALPVQAGFPQTIPEATAPGIALLDADGTGQLSVALATVSGSILLIDSAGRARAGWPQQITAGCNAPPAAGDLDGDGRPEVVIADASGRLHAWRVDGTRLPGWPVRLAGEDRGLPRLQGAPALGDVDGDGRREIAVATVDGQVALFDASGTLRPGWPQRMTAATDPPNAPAAHASPAIADLDGDRQAEILVASNAGRVHAWHATGESLPGWPVRVPHGGRSGYADLAVADLDGDGQPEVVVVSERGLHGPPTVTVYDPHGQPRPGWPQPLPETANAGAAIGDLTGDGGPEIVVATIGGNATVQVFDAAGNAAGEAWPAHFRESTINAAPLLADLDGNGASDLILATLATGPESQSSLWALDPRGVPLPGFPILLAHDEIVTATPAIGDLDGDGDLELVAVTERLNMLHAWDLPGLADDRALPWPALAGGPAHPGWSEPRPWRGPVGRPPGNGTAPPEQGLPPGPLTTISFELVQSADVCLSIFNIQGQSVRRLLEHDLPPGRYAIYWDGRDDRGVAQKTGIYFYQLSLGERATTRQLLLLQ